MKISPFLLVMMLALLFQSNELHAAARSAESGLAAPATAALKESHKTGRMERKAKRWQKRLNKWQKKFEKKQKKWDKRGKFRSNFNLGFLGLVVMLFGGLFILLGLVIPVLGVLFLVIGIIVAFVGLLLFLLLGSISVELSE